MTEELASRVREYKKTGDLKLRNQILEDHLDFIKKQVSFLCFDLRYKKDFEQEAMIGFLEALERYKEEGNFNTCMFWGIKKRILDFYRKSRSSVKTTNRYNILLSIVRKHKAKFFEKHGREMTDEDLSLVLTRKEMHVWELSQAESCGVDQIENLKEYSVNESVERELAEEYHLEREKLRAILSEMPNEESWLIKTRYGIDTNKQNLAEIGFYLKKTPQRIEQMQRAIEGKIRKRLNLKHTLGRNITVPSRSSIGK
jgi:RNA polymerase sigma factor (sigma-70 family)